MTPGEEVARRQQDLAQVGPCGSLHSGPTVPQAQCQDYACLLVPLLASLCKQGTERVMNFRKAAQPVDGEARFFPDWPYFKVSTFSVQNEHWGLLIPILLILT